MVEDFRRSLAFQADCLAGRVGGVGMQSDEYPVCDRGARPTARHAKRTECRDRVPAHHTIVARGLGSGNGLSYRRANPDEARLGANPRPTRRTTGHASRSLGRRNSAVIRVRQEPQ